MIRIRLPTLSYHSNRYNFSLESFEPLTTNFICPAWPGRPGPAFRLDLKLLPPMGTGRVAEMCDPQIRKLLT